MKTVLLCLSGLEIGGVATAVLTEVYEWRRMGYRVVVLARDGIYRRIFEERGGVEFIDFAFIPKEGCKWKKIDIVRDILDKYHVEQVHIHSFDCVNVVFPACILNRVPYVAYLHCCGNLKVDEYAPYEGNYPYERAIFSMYFHNAEKIVAIREYAKQENIEKYKVAEDKYVVIKNSLDLDDFKVQNNEAPTNIKNFLIVSRFNIEKADSIKNALHLFKKYSEQHAAARLTIVGDGPEKVNILKEVENIQSKVKVLGSRNDIAEIVAKHDVVMALDRCILEAIAMKKIAVLSGYDGLKGIVTPDNIKKASDENFGGANMDNISLDNVIKELESLDAREIKKITEGNYKFALKELNINHNIYIIKEKRGSRLQFDVNNAIENVILLQNLYQECADSTNLAWREHQAAEKWYHEQIQRLEEYKNEGIKATSKRLMKMVGRKITRKSH